MTHTPMSCLATGDGDPLDVVEISQLPCQVGDVYAVRVLGVLGMIDEGEMDWKLVCINAADPLAAELPGTHPPQHPSPPAPPLAPPRTHRRDWGHRRVRTLQM